MDLLTFLCLCLVHCAFTSVILHVCFTSASGAELRVHTKITLPSPKSQMPYCQYSRPFTTYYPAGQPLCLPHWQHETDTADLELGGHFFKSPQMSE